MRTRNRVALAVMFIAGWPALSAAQDRTDQELVEVIMRDGPRARAIRAAADVVAFEQAARLAFPNPSASYTREGAGFTEFLQVEQPLPAFGLRDTLARAGVAARNAAEAERDVLLWALANDAWTLLARLRIEAERLSVAENNAVLVEQLIAILRTREQEGEGSRFDRVRAEQELAEARQAIVSASMAVADARSSLAGLLPSGTPVPAVAAASTVPRAADSLEVLISRARSSRAELRALQHVAARFDLEAEVARRAMRPAPVVLGGLKRADDGGDRHAGAVAGVSVNVPLFNSGKREAARWTAERLRVEAERLAVEANIRAQVTRASEALALRQQALSALSATLRAADELVSIADVAYREGDIGILELLDAYRTVSRARLRAIDVNLEVRLAELALERAVGEPLWP